MLRISKMESKGQAIPKRLRINGFVATRLYQPLLRRVY
jgi:hypothetical protein